MKTSTRHLYPHSEAVFRSWETDQVDAGATAIVKLAFTSLKKLDTTFLGAAASRNDFPDAQECVWNAAATHRDYLEQARYITGSGCQLVRYHALGDQQTWRGGPPRPESPYWRALSLFFTHINGPLAGEEVFVVPPAIDAEVGLSRLHVESHVAFSDELCLGAATVEYNRAKTQVAARTFYEAPHETARQASGVARALFHRDLEAYRLPYVRPPEEVEALVGMRAIETSYYIQPPDGFDALLPPGLSGQ